MNKRHILLLLLFLFLPILLFGCKAKTVYELPEIIAEDASVYGITETNLSTKEKLEDFNYIYELLKSDYPFFEVNERIYGVDWLNNKDLYEEIIKSTKNDAEFLVAMYGILDELNNPHTNICEGVGFTYLYTYYYTDYNPYGLFEYFDAFNDPVVLERYNPTTENFASDNASPIIQENYKLDIINDNSIYIKINEMAPYDQAIRESQIIKNFIEESSKSDKLIIDIRGNYGGNDGYWQEIVRCLIDEMVEVKYPTLFKEDIREDYDMFYIENLTPIEEIKSELLNRTVKDTNNCKYYKTQSVRLFPSQDKNIDFNGKVYLLIDSGVFSSSEKFASFAKDSGFATLIGETTSGDRVFEHIPIDYLPNSGLIFRYSREMGINVDGTINMETRTTPHIEVDPTPNDDYTKDLCIMTALED
ncbi:MAG: hypothetical protein GXZ08_03585 [Tissierellia bacterium]|nr:hypothetical protein [Tissierellia bacterium]